jgi:indolepyruvate ferredoxin oxidoreductase alpha subunit
VNACNLNEAKLAGEKAVEQKGVRVIVFEGACIALGKKEPAYIVDIEKCTNCKLCVKKFGCPALFLSAGKVCIDEALCTGCGVCGAVCPAEAITGSALCST